MADLHVNFYLKTKEKIESTSSPSVSLGYFSGGIGYRYGVGYGSDVEVTQYTEGTLYIDVIDTSEKKLIWQGIAIGQIWEKDTEDFEASVSEVIAEIFKRYPIALPTAYQKATAATTSSTKKNKSY